MKEQNAGRYRAPLSDGRQQGSILQRGCTALCEDLPCQLEPAMLHSWVFYSVGFLLCSHPWFSVIVKAATCTSHIWVFSSNFKPASRHLTVCAAYTDPWIQSQWVSNTHPVVYWLLTSSGSLALVQTVFCLGQGLPLVCLMLTLKCLINTLLKEVEKTPLKPLQALPKHTLPVWGLGQNL